MDPFAVDTDLAMGGFEKAAQNIEERRFGATGWTDEADEFAALHFDVDVFENPHRLARPIAWEGHPQVANRNDRGGCSLWIGDAHSLKSLRKSRSSVAEARLSSRRVAPTNFVEFFQTPDEQVESEADDADENHAGDNQIVAFAGIAGIDDEETESGVDGNHFGCDNDEPGDAEGDAQSSN